MERSAMGDPTAEQLNRWMMGQREVLARRYQDVLRRTLFTNRSEVRPAMLGRIATAEVASLKSFFRRSAEVLAVARGRRLCRMGLSEETMLELGCVTRRFCLEHIPGDLRPLALDQVERYHSAVMQSFIREQRAMTLEEQERIHAALQFTLRRYALQMEVAADIARTLTPIGDLQSLLQTAVKLIRKRFGLYYVALFLADTDHRWAILHASSGEISQIMLRRGYRLEIGGDSMVGWCLAHGQPRIGRDIGERAIGVASPLLADVRSEMVVPLAARGRVIGALALQSQAVGAFYEYDLRVMRLTADQLSGAIENARLFDQLRQELPAALELARDPRPAPARLPYELDRAGVVLVIDESPAVRERLLGWLGALGLSALVAASAEEGLHLAQQLRPRLIVLDPRTPGRDGGPLLAALRAHPDLAHTPVLTLAAVDEAGSCTGGLRRV